MAERRVHTPSLVVGLLAVSIAVLSLLDRTAVIAVDERVVAAGVLVALGVGGVAASVGRLVLGTRPTPTDAVDS